MRSLSLTSVTVRLTVRPDMPNDLIFDNDPWTRFAQGVALEMNVATEQGRMRSAA